MSKKRINIAYFTADWNRELVSVALNAARQYLEDHRNLYIQVFDCFSFALYSGRDGSGYQIYDLPDLGKYDAVLIQSHQIMDTNVIRHLEQRIQETGIPAISIGARMKGCTFIGTDDYTAARKISEHLLMVHGCKTFLYLKGSERDDGRGEAEIRRTAFEDACRDMGIPSGNISYFDGGWESRKGMEAVKTLLEERKPLPDAIVSANDEMALGAIGALEDAGIKIPEQVIVTGYDGIMSASLSDPELTTISRDFDKLIKTAIETLIAKIHHKEVPDRIFSPFKIIFSQSCGCRKTALTQLYKAKKMYYLKAREDERYYFQQDTMTADLFRADSSKVLPTIEKHFRIFGKGHTYIYANDFYFDHYMKKVNDSYIERNDTPFADTLVLCAIGGMEIERKEDFAYMRISRNNLINAPLLKDEQMTIFYPLNFKNVNIGFIVLNQPPTVEEMHRHENIVNLCVFALENARQRIQTRKLNDKLNELYMHDQMTGLYNRFGYDQIAENMYLELLKRNADIHVLFLDIDNMKNINDSFGHDQGDLAIRTVSDVMKKSCRKSDFKMRYGGDEFVIITEAGNIDLKNRLKEKFRQINESKTLSFHLGVSIGDYTIHGSKPESLDDLLRHADEMMYQDKSKKKNSMTSDLR